MPEKRITICPKCKKPATESSDYAAAVYYKGLSTFTCKNCGFKGPVITITEEEFNKLNEAD